MRPIPPTPDRSDDPINPGRGCVVAGLAVTFMAAFLGAAISLCNDFYRSTSASRQETTLGSSYRSAGVR